MLDRQSGPATLGEPQDARNKPYRPFLPWWTGSRLFQEVTVQIPEQATSQHFGSPAAYTSILSEGQVPQRTMHKLLYEPLLDQRVAHSYGSPSLLGIAEFIVPTGSFFHAQTHVSFHIIEELSPNVRMIPKRRPLDTHPCILKQSAPTNSPSL